MTLPVVPGTPDPYGRAQNANMQLAASVAWHVAAGWRVESQTTFQAVLVSGAKVNHLLHFVVGLFTCGFWWLFWILIAALGGESRMVLTVDDSGTVHQTKPVSS